MTSNSRACLGTKLICVWTSGPIALIRADGHIFLAVLESCKTAKTKRWQILHRVAHRKKNLFT